MAAAGEMCTHEPVAALSQACARREPDSATYSDDACKRCPRSEQSCASAFATPAHLCSEQI
eukprot:3170823-Pleurochrysis_carterae.AAC.3